MEETGFFPSSEKGSNKSENGGSPSGRHIKQRNCETARFSSFPNKIAKNKKKRDLVPLLCHHHIDHLLSSQQFVFHSNILFAVDIAQISLPSGFLKPSLIFSSTIFFFFFLPPILLVFPYKLRTKYSSLFLIRQHSFETSPPFPVYAEQKCFQFLLRHMISLLVRILSSRIFFGKMLFSLRFLSRTWKTLLIQKNYSGHFLLLFGGTEGMLLGIVLHTGIHVAHVTRSVYSSSHVSYV